MKIKKKKINLNVSLSVQGGFDGRTGEAGPPTHFTITVQKCYIHVNILIIETRCVVTIGESKQIYPLGEVSFVTKKFREHFELIRHKNI